MRISSNLTKIKLNSSHNGTQKRTITGPTPIRFGSQTNNLFSNNPNIIPRTLEGLILTTKMALSLFFSCQSYVLRKID